MKKEIFIQSTLHEIRVAITENNRLAELFWELPEKERNVSNIYLGRVQRIIQGMNAAFVDIGQKQDAFLHFSDVGDLLEETENDTDEQDDGEAPDGMEDDENLTETAAVALRKKNLQNSDFLLPTFATKRSGQVTINLEPGQWVLVQVTREAYGSKGLRVTTKISLPGRYLVLLPFSPSIGVSKKIWNMPERKRLRTIARSILPEGVGCIVRTEAQEQDDESFRKDLEDLRAKWLSIQTNVQELGEQPGLVYRDISMAQSLIRDLLTADVQHVTIDSRKLYTGIRTYAEWAAPRLAPRIRLYTGTTPLFDAFGLKNEIERSYSRIVGLPSGGYLVIDHTEAMTVIDVNSGRYAPDRDQETNSLRTNIEAVREIARQLRIRDIGGMIVIDCIDLQDERNRRRLVEEMHREIQPDRAQVVVYPLTQLGLMQLTRKRVRQNIQQIVSQPCATCNGTGYVPSKSLIIAAIERWLKFFHHAQKTSERSKHPVQQPREYKLVLRVHPTIASELRDGTMSTLARFMIKFFVKISLEHDEKIPVEHFRFFSVRRQRDITNEYRQ